MRHHPVSRKHISKSGCVEPNVSGVHYGRSYCHVCVDWRLFVFHLRILYLRQRNDKRICKRLLLLLDDFEIPFKSAGDGNETKRRTYNNTRMTSKRFENAHESHTRSVSPITPLLYIITPAHGRSNSYSTGCGCLINN